MYGWIGTILRINLSDGSIKKETLNEKWAKEYLGARGLGTKYYTSEVNHDVEPLSEDNKLIFMTGPLTGTFATSSGRYNVVTKGPLTGTIAASNSGGFFGPELKYAGYDGIILEGKAKAPVYLYIKDGDVELKDAAELWGKNTSETTDMLTEKYGSDYKVACIGPAGEKLVLYAGVMNDKNRAAGRTGVGAVMGYKNLKAVVVRGSKSIKIADPEGFYEVCKDARIKLKEHPVTGTGLGTYGTEILVNIINGIGAFPTNNWKESTFDKADETGGEALVDKYLLRGKGCFACGIGCGRLTKVTGEFEGYGEGPEYEAAWALGADCGIDDLGAICKANFICNEFGMDPITLGSTIACAMEMYEKGIITEEELGGPLKFGDGKALVDFTTKIGLREGFGDIMALGSYRMAEKYG
ncbi:MAG: aldehyde ferredoxin oxidoreductase family protein, partial [Clostridia bacterium]|nr:aldehyde ferredoxin oxidoreductase family protein [Clostridia bacterium]